MTPEQIDALVASIPDDLSDSDRADVMALVKDLRDPDIGDAVEKMYRMAIQAGSWEAFLASVDGRTAIGTSTSGNHGHVGRPGKVGGSGQGKQHSFEEDKAKFFTLKAQWAELNNHLLTLIDNPTSPECQEKMNELKEVVKEMYRLNADTGEEIGLPGGHRDIVIVGAGPGGLASAIMGGTDGLDTLCVDAQTVAGGQSKYSSRIENFPGFPPGVTGTTLSQNMFEQAQRVGAQTSLGVRVTGLSYDAETQIKTLTLSDGRTVTARAVILAGGVEMKTMTFPGSTAKNVISMDSNSVTRAGAGGDVVIIGGSNGAAQAALGAATSAKSVTIISRSPIEKGMSDYQISALRNHAKIKVIENDEIAAATTDQAGAITGVTTKGGHQLSAKALGLFVGGGPNLKWLPETIKRKDGKIDVDGDLQTSMPGVYAVGDNRHGGIGRIGGAVGDGQMAERNAYQFIHGMRKKTDAN